MSGATIIILGTILAYMCLLIGVGVYNSRKNTNSENFYLGGRKMGPLVVAMSAEASDMSSWLLMGLPGLAYFSGLAEPFWTAAGLALGTYLNWLITSRRLRRYSQTVDAYTVPGFFAKRFHDERHIISAIAAVMFVVFFTPYVASGLSACGKLVNMLFGMDYFTGVLLFAVIIMIYTMIGGYTSVATNDLIQSIVMSIALVSITMFGISVAGGFDAVMDNAKEIPGYLTVAQTTSIVTKEAAPWGFLASVSTFAWGIGYFGMPHVLVRFMSIEDEKKLVLSRRIASIWVVIAMGVAIFIGVIGLAASRAGGVETFQTASDAEKIISALANLLSTHGFFAAVIAGVILAGILAATMSTADSQLLVVASGVSEDIIQDFMGKKLSAKQSLIISRITILAIIAFAVFFARDPNSSVFRIVSFAWAGIGASFAGVMICSLFWKRTTLQGAIAGIVVGGGMALIWKFGISTLGGAFAIYELLPAFLCSLAAIIIVSLCTKAPSQEILDEFESVNQKA